LCEFSRLRKIRYIVVLQILRNGKSIHDK
jgi:hypothetical protein